MAGDRKNLGGQPAAVRVEKCRDHCGRQTQCESTRGRIAGESEGDSGAASIGMRQNSSDTRRQGANEVSPTDDERTMQAGPQHEQREQPQGPLQWSPTIGQLPQHDSRAQHSRLLRSDHQDLEPAGGKPGDTGRDSPAHPAACPPAAGAGGGAFGDDQDRVQLLQCQKTAEPFSLKPHNRYEPRGVDEWRRGGAGNQRFKGRDTLEGDPAAVGEVPPQVGMPQRKPAEVPPDKPQREGRDSGGGGQSGGKVSETLNWTRGASFRTGGRSGPISHRGFTGGALTFGSQHT